MTTSPADQTPLFVSPCGWEQGPIWCIVLINESKANRYLAFFSWYLRQEKKLRSEMSAYSPKKWMEILLLSADTSKWGWGLPLHVACHGGQSGSGPPGSSKRDFSFWRTHWTSSIVGTWIYLGFDSPPWQTGLCEMSTGAFWWKCNAEMGCLTVQPVAPSALVQPLLESWACSWQPQRRKIVGMNMKSKPVNPRAFSFHAQESENHLRAKKLESSIRGGFS